MAHADYWSDYWEALRLAREAQREEQRESDRQAHAQAARGAACFPEALAPEASGSGSADGDAIPRHFHIVYGGDDEDGDSSEGVVNE